MPNFFDQFDEAQKPGAQSGNYFDQFDGPVTPPKGKKPLRGQDQGAARKRAQSDLDAAGRGLLSMIPGGVGIYQVLPDQLKKHAQSLGSGTLRGATFSFDDELIGIVGRAVDLVTGGKSTYGDQWTAARRNAQDMSAEQAPVADVAGQFAGGFFSPVNKVLAPVAIGAKGTQAATTLAGVAGQGARAGAVYGGAYGFGADEGGFIDRLDGTATGVAFGGVLGAPLAVAIKGGGDAISRRFAPQGGDRVLEATRQGLGIRRQDIGALRQVLKESGYTSDDIDRGFAALDNAQQSAISSGERAGLLITEIQKSFPKADENLRNVFQHLWHDPKAGGVVREALDGQYASQVSHLDDVAQQRLGTSTVVDEQAALAAERQQIGAGRESALEAARGVPNNSGTVQLRKSMQDWRSDPEGERFMRAAARLLGHRRTNTTDEIESAISDDPLAFGLKVQEIIFKGSQRPSGISETMMGFRDEIQEAISLATRYSRKPTPGGKGPGVISKNTDELSPFDEAQSGFRRTYSQDEAIAEARGRFAQARDPIKADEFVNWYQSLPDGEKRLAQTVLRQDMERMLRGGKIDDYGARLTELKSQGVHDVLVRVLGKDGEDISRAISRLADEQAALKSIDPRRGIQERGPSRALDEKAIRLYTTNPIARIGNKIPALAQGADIALITTGNLPWMTIAKQGSKLFRPRAPTREALAKILSARYTPATGRATGRAPISGTQATGLASATAGGGNPQISGPSPRAVLQLPTPRSDQRPARHIVTIAQVRANMAARKVEQARQRVVDAEARKATAEQIRALRIEAARTEGEARVAMEQAKAAERITDDIITEVARSARTRHRTVRGTSNRERNAHRRLARAESEVQRSGDINAASNRIYETTTTAARREADASRLKSDAHRRLDRTERHADAINRQAVVDDAKQMAREDYEPRAIFEETGLIALKGDDGAIVLIKPDKRGYYHAMREIQARVFKAERTGKIDDDLTRQVMTSIGANAVREGRFRGWTTPARRQTVKGVQIGAGIGTGAVGVGLGAIALRDHRDRKENRRYEELVSNPEVTKAIQRALKKVGDYGQPTAEQAARAARNGTTPRSPAADGRFDEDVARSLARWQGTYGVTGTNGSGEMDKETFDLLVKELQKLGYDKEADALEAYRPQRTR